jgi:hypothetical protein
MYKGRVRRHAICLIEGMGNNVVAPNSFYLFSFEDRQMLYGPTFPLINDLPNFKHDILLLEMNLKITSHLVVGLTFNITLTLCSRPHSSNVNGCHHEIALTILDVIFKCSH